MLKTLHALKHHYHYSLGQVIDLFEIVQIYVNKCEHGFAEQIQNDLDSSDFSTCEGKAKKAKDILEKLDSSVNLLTLTKFMNIATEEVILVSNLNNLKTLYDMI